MHDRIDDERKWVAFAFPALLAFDIEGFVCYLLMHLSIFFPTGDAGDGCTLDGLVRIRSSK